MIHTYETTGLLNTLNQNIPTIILFQKFTLRGLNENAQHHFLELLENNILFTDYKLASKFINKIWNNIDDWWLNKKTQKAIDNFCNEYSRSCENPIEKLKNILN